MTANHPAVLRARFRSARRKDVAKLSGPKTTMRGLSVSLVTLKQLDAIVAAATEAYERLGATSKVKQSDLATEAVDDWVARWLQRFGPVPDASDKAARRAYVEKLVQGLEADGIEALLSRKVS